MKYLKFLIMMSIIPMLTSCSKDFFDTEQTGVMSEETFFESMDNIKLSVNGTYASLNYLPGGLQNLDVECLFFGSIASDDSEAGGEQGGNDITDVQNMDRGKPQPSESRAVSDYFWAYNYKTILRANSTLAGIKKFRETNGNLSASDLKLLSQYTGEMNFILAFIHFKLMQVYGGVPIVDHILGSEEYNIERDSISAVLHFVESRLQIASNDLPKKSEYAAGELGRATKGAAQALLAKAFLYEASYAKNYPGDARFSGCGNTYSQALVYADSVIASGEYKLVGIDGETFDTYWNQNNSPIYPDKTPAYRWIFSVDGENSQESIFEIQSINDKQDYMLTRGTYLTVYTTVRNYTNGNPGGWGFNCPTDYLLNAYDSLDIRKKVTIGRYGDPVYISGAWTGLDPKQSPTYMIGRKFEASPAQYWDTKATDGNGPNNFPYIRYADVMLMAAEAGLELNQNTPVSGLSPLQIVNMVRKRARNGAATGVPADITGPLTLDQVINERRLELACEGHRFFDLVRWKKQDILENQELMKYLGGKPVTPIMSEFTPGKNDFFPIPEKEIIRSNNHLQQYPGW